MILNNLCFLEPFYKSLLVSSKKNEQFDPECLKYIIPAVIAFAMIKFEPVELLYLQGIFETSNDLLFGNEQDIDPELVQKFKRLRDKYGDKSSNYLLVGEYPVLMFDRINDGEMSFFEPSGFFEIKQVESANMLVLSSQVVELIQNYCNLNEGSGKTFKILFASQVDLPSLGYKGSGYQMAISFFGDLMERKFNLSEDLVLYLLRYLYTNKIACLNDFYLELKDEKNPEKGYLSSYESLVRIIKN